MRQAVRRAATQRLDCWPAGRAQDSQEPPARSWHVCGLENWKMQLQKDSTVQQPATALYNFRPAAAPQHPAAASATAPYALRRRRLATHSAAGLQQKVRECAFGPTYVRQIWTTQPDYNANHGHANTCMLLSEAYEGMLLVIFQTHTHMERLGSDQQQAWNTSLFSPRKLWLPCSPCPRSMKSKKATLIKVNQCFTLGRLARSPLLGTTNKVKESHFGSQEQQAVLPITCFLLLEKK